MKKEYKKDNLTITWEPDKCIHSGICWKGLNRVFKPKSRPWVDVDGAEIGEITAQIGNCPSGALGFYFDREEKKNLTPDFIPEKTTIQVIKDGPYLIKGKLEISDSSEATLKKKVFLCRCGHSSKKPYCDGSHKRKGFKG